MMMEFFLNTITLMIRRILHGINSLSEPPLIVNTISNFKTSIMNRQFIYSLSVFFLLSDSPLIAQVRTNFNNETLIGESGRFSQPYSVQIDFQVPGKNLDVLLAIEKRYSDNMNAVLPFQIAAPIPVDLNISKLIKWSIEKEFAYGKFVIKLNGALSSSINFNEFYLPRETEMFIYNRNGNMITGPITEKENNQNKIWGSWVYKGELLIIEIKTPSKTKDNLLLHSNNIAYGYKEVYKVQVGGFGQSAPCHINVLCPLGAGWGNERNSVSLILSDNGSSWCSGSLVMNTCNNTRPFSIFSDLS